MKRIVPVIAVPALVATVILCFVAWARSVDPYLRKELTISGIDAHCTAILPKRTNDNSKYAVVMFVRHANERTARTPDMRQFADVGLGGVVCDLNAKSEQDFERQVSAVGSFLKRQPWVDGAAMASMEFAGNSPRLVVRTLPPANGEPLLVANLANESAEHHIANTATDPDEPLSNAHGETSTELQARRVSDTNQAVTADERVVVRCIAEYCKSKLTPNQPYPELPAARPIPIWFCFVIPMAAVVFGAFSLRKPMFAQLYGVGFKTATSVTRLLTNAVVRLCLLACAVFGLFFSFVHLIVPTLRVTPRSLAICRTFLVPRSSVEDFDRLASLPVWNNQRVGSLLEHLDLANYTVSRLLNWKVNRSVYGDYVLSPVIEESLEGKAAELNWRKELWKNFWPRVRHENSPDTAADIVVRYLRERVTIAPNFVKQAGVDSAWSKKIANDDDFEALYVASLRSVGIPARLTGEHHAEIWNTKGWCAAPRPPVVNWLN